MRLFVIVIAAFAVVGLLGASGAHAQWYSSYPQTTAYPASPQRPYAVEIAPHTYVIHRPRKSSREREPARRIDVVHTHSKKIVREKPVVIEHERLVDDPPRVIERHISEEAGRGLLRTRRDIADEGEVVEPDEHPPLRPTKSRSAADRVTEAHTEQVPVGKRVIKADAEITILGPDRMSIRLFRKRHGGAKTEVQ